MIWFRGRKNCQRISENRRIKRSRESGFSLTRYLLWCVYVIVKGEGFDLYFVTEKPAEQSSAGLLRLDTNISRRYYIYFFGAKHLGIRFVDYSMIVATLPEPTVLPPSRYQNGVLQRLNGYFPFVLCGKIRIFRCVRVVFGDFVIMVLSLSIFTKQSMFQM